MSNPEPVPVEITPKRRSYSQLSSYARCGEAYRLTRLVRPKLPQRPAAWTAHGLAFHEAAETWERNDRQEDFVELYSAAFDAQIEAFTEIQPNLWMWQRPWNKKTTELHIAAQKETGLEQARNYPQFIKNYGMDILRDENDMPAIEIGFELDFSGVPVVGYIDIVRQFGEQVIPVDIKTGNRVKANTQLGLYKIALEETYGMSVSHGEFLYTKGGRNTPNQAEVEKVNLDQYTRPYFEEMFATLERGIQAEVFLPAPSDACGLCAVKSYCREKGETPIPLAWDAIDVNDRWWGNS